MTHYAGPEACNTQDATRDATLDHAAVNCPECLSRMFRAGGRRRTVARAELHAEATFDPDQPRFVHHPPGGQPVPYHLDWREAAERGEAFFRIDHPLAQEMVQRALGRELPIAAVTFDYAAHGAPVAILAERRGQQGWLRLDRVDVASIETEQHLVLVAVTDDGAVLDREWCERLLDLPATTGPSTSVPPERSSDLEREAERAEQRVVADVEARNAAWFDDEVQKLDLWADDMKIALERELKDLDAAIKAARKASKDAVSLQDKLAAQKEVKSLDGKRHDKRRQLFEAQDDIERRRNGLIEDIERRLGTTATRETMFTLRWTLT